MKSVHLSRPRVNGRGRRKPPELPPCPSCGGEVILFVDPADDWRELVCIDCVRYAAADDHLDD